MSREKLYALFMTAIILATPLSTASAFAGIIGTSVFGDDKIDGFRRETDFTYAVANVTLPDDSNIAPSQLLFNREPFTSCRKEADYTSCVYGMPKSTMTPGTTSYSVTLFSDSDAVADEATGTLTIDSMPPVVEGLKLSPTITKKGNVTLSYSVADYATGTTPGVGLAKIVVTKNDLGNVIKEITFNESKTSFAEELNLKTSEFSSGASGTTKLCVGAYDRLNQFSGLSCDNVTIDEKDPKIVQNSLNLTLPNGNALGYISSNPLEVMVGVTVEDDSLASVVADLSELNVNYPDYAAREGSCVPLSPGKWRCSWPGLIMSTTQKTVKVTFNATDAAGNTGSASMSASLKLDAKAPVVKSIKNANAADNENILGKNNELVVAIDDDESGMGGNQAWILVGGRKVQAESCTKEGGTWRCSWDLPMDASSGNSALIMVSPNTADDVGNAIDMNKSVTSATFTVDVKGPLIQDVVIATSGVNRSYAAAEIVAGDSFTIQARVLEKSALTATADLSAIGLGNAEAGSCSKNESETQWVCSWQPSPVETGPVSGYLKLKFTDAVGNTASRDVPIRVLGIYTGENPDNWELFGVQKMPKAIDRQTTELISHKVYVHPILSPRANCPTSIEAIEVDCAGDMDSIAGYELINKGNDPYIVLTLAQDAMPESSLSLTCTLKIISRVGDTINVNPEEEPVEFTIDFYNLGLGEIAQNVRDKITNAQKGWLVQQTWLGTLEGILNIAESICRLLSVWGEFNEVMADIELLMGTTMGETPTAQGFRNFVEKSDTAYKEFVNGKYNFCKYISCDVTIWGEWYEKMSVEKTPEVFKEMRFGNAFWPSSPKDSIVLSLATGCIPGIIHNLQKRRQVECLYIVCMKQAASDGIPLSVCDEQKSYLECKYLFGEIFQVVPFAAFFQGLAQQFQMIVSDPIGMIFAGINFYCTYEPTVAGHSVCVIGHLVPTIGAIVDDITSIVETDWSLKGDVCKAALEPLPEKTVEKSEGLEEEGATENESAGNESETQEEE